MFNSVKENINDLNNCWNKKKMKIKSMLNNTIIIYLFV